MLPTPELPPRPEPPRAVVRELAERLRWFGLGRLVAAAISVAVVGAGVVWLVRAPAPPSEAALPVASASSAPTLPPPSTLAVAAGSAGSAALVAATSAAPARIVVHVAGAVTAPGVYQVDGSARAADAVAAAGGPAPDGDLDALNLAAPLADGQRVYVPRVGEVDPASVPSGGAPAAAPGGSEAPSGPVDLNTATAEQLDGLPGVGPATAAAIVDDRAQNGPFASVDDLDRVSGIGPAKLDALRDLVTV